MDKILKEHFDRFIEKGELPPELQELNGEVTLFDDKELLQVWRNNFKGIQWTDDKGNVFMGAVDNILKIEDKLIVLDYKTRGYALKEDTHKYYQDQMDIYNFLLRNNGYQTEDYTYLLFYHPNKIDENGSVDFHADLIKIKINVKNAENIFKRAVDVLEGEMPEPSDECGFCKWIYECNCEMK
ncbi:MAG: PD-(D/E)XK nuclease family protein [Methanocellales archaeon]|nr:PD-(D/E)XK nuclease family protein [Methanocellales archaeon]